MSSAMQGYVLAKEQYAKYGVDIDQAIRICDQIPISVHCWQLDDIRGFESGAGELTGGIQTTGDHPGKARNFEEMTADLEKVLSYLPGEKKVSLHAFYLDDRGENVDRDQIEPKHFERWIDWAVANQVGLDMNGSFFSHPNSASGYTLASSDPEIRRFWIEHGKRTREIAAVMAKRTGKTVLNNIWVPDGEKEVPIDTMTPRQLLKSSLEEVTAVPYEGVVDSVESKLFGIGSESYVVGSHEFYLGYGLTHSNTLVTYDTGHFHPTESVAAKLSSTLLFKDRLLLHVSRPVRWDSDHVVSFDDETRAIMSEIVRLNALDKVYIALDYFDASINRVMALAIGARNARKALLEALLQPVDLLRTAEQSGDLGSRLALQQELKAMPLSLVWDYYCESREILTGKDWVDDAKAYETNVLFKRV